MRTHRLSVITSFVSLRNNLAGRHLADKWGKIVCFKWHKTFFKSVCYNWLYSQRFLESRKSSQNSWINSKHVCGDCSQEISRALNALFQSLQMSLEGSPKRYNSMALKEETWGNRKLENRWEANSFHWTGFLCPLNFSLHAYVITKTKPNQNKQNKTKNTEKASGEKLYQLFF